MTEQPKIRVVLGMSGGVDSSTAAVLLLQQGFEVIGITMKLWPQDCLARAEDKCCGPEAVADARGVAWQLGIPFYVLDESEAFREQVVEHFAEEYKAGRTPNPCVICNRQLKFGTLLQRARQLGAEKIATGHYARVELDGATGRHLLKRALDPRKDQSYFLFSLSQEQLAHAVFPLGAMTKPQTREKARVSGLQTAQKQESMEICFVPDDDYREFLLKSGLVIEHPGEIVDRQGRVLGRHSGIEFFTIGQRRGLGVATGKPLYVVALEPAGNRVVVGDDSQLLREACTIIGCNWIVFERLSQPIEVTAKIRYNHPGAPASVSPGPEGSAEVRFHTPQRAVTPGQACVLYQEDLVLGGGWISR